MATREKLLALLAARKGAYISGEEIGDSLSVSRAAVWKAVKALQGEGYAIDAVRNKGYCLPINTDILSAQGVSKYLEPACDLLTIEVLQTAASTNALVRERANASAPEGYTLIAREQTAGRGRRGRAFFSPAGTGVYVSLLLRPKRYAARQAVRITTIAAVAMCEAIEAVTGEAAGIKWVNDIFMRGKKVCGILTEAVFDMENDQIQYAVLGAGVNVYAPREGFPPELAKIAGSVLEAPSDDAKNRLTAAFLNRFMAYYADLDATDYAEKYAAYSLAVGKRITVLSGDAQRSAAALGVDPECRLLVRYDDGTEASLASGEISIRL